MSRKPGGAGRTGRAVSAVATVGRYPWHSDAVWGGLTAAESVIHSIRSHEEAMLIDSAGVNLLHAHGGNDTVDFTADQAVLFGPTLTMTHNHPLSLADPNRRLSATDMRFVIATNLKELRAVYADGSVVGIHLGGRRPAGMRDGHDIHTLSANLRVADRITKRSIRQTRTYLENLERRSKRSDPLTALEKDHLAAWRRNQGGNEEGITMRLAWHRLAAEQGWTYYETSASR